MWVYSTILATLAAGFFAWLWKQSERRARSLAKQLRETEAALGMAKADLERTLADARSREEALFNSMGEGVLILDEDSRILLVNRAIDDLFGTRGDVRGRKLIEAFHMHELQQLADAASASGKASMPELTLRGSGNRVVQVNAAAIGAVTPGPKGTIFVLHDLTLLKRLEETRREFVANVSHELRTPLSMIKGYVETLIDGAMNDPEVAARFLGIIERHTNRLTYLIEDLLLLSSLESGQSLLSLHPLNLRRVVTATLEDLESKAATKQIELRNDVPEALVVDGDGDRLQQVLFNLVDNAIKYGNPKGTVTVGGGKRDGEFVEAWVRDNGPGIPREARERIFERFYRVDKARSRDLGGTGLGLAIVKHIVLQHGGDVWVVSEPGQGASFHFTLRSSTEPLQEPEDIQGEKDSRG